MPNNNHNTFGFACTLIFTGIRTRPLRHIHKDQIEDDRYSWLENIKARRDATIKFRMPLSSETLEILKHALAFS